ncbi:serine hydrolase [Priestia endophytica]|uniref:serine hydrolase n=1 Tax=Priestia endophytica TaxID=135735 RepID=UPI002E2412E1|nr:serine hydrolase [Priestia endophytica]MED4073643.1 serine hydrolase [Priestia endophytica]
MKLTQRLFVGIVASLLVLQLWIVAPIAHAQEVDKPNLESGAAILVEAQTGKVLYEKDADAVRGIASMTKMMTEYLLLENIDEGKLSWDDTYEPSDYAYKISQNLSLSNVPLAKGEKYTLRELFEAMSMYSANGASIAIAEKISGNETNFVKMMNEKAKELGMKDAKFVNATGLSNSDLQGMHPKGTKASDENLVSARSTAKLASHLINDYPEVLETSKLKEKTFHKGKNGETQMKSWNWMLPGLVYEYKKAEVDGLKTGSTDFAGYCFTGTAEKDGARYITVVMDAKDHGQESYEARFSETAKLLDYAFDNFEVKTLHPAGYTLKEKVKVAKGNEKEAKVTAKEPLKVVVEKGKSAKKAVKTELVVNEKKLNSDGKLIAPIKKGEEVGYINVKYKDDQFGYLTTEGENQSGVPIVMKEDIDKANWFSLMFRSIGDFFADMWTSAANMVKGWF